MATNITLMACELAQEEASHQGDRDATVGEKYPAEGTSMGGA